MGTPRASLTPQGEQALANAVKAINDCTCTNVGPYRYIDKNCPVHKGK